VSNRTCKITDCERIHFGNGLCNAHWQRMKYAKKMDRTIRHNRPNGETKVRNEKGEKFCISCKLWVSEKDFQINPRSADKRQPYCNNCNKSKNILKKYGITNREMALKLEAQGGGCEICGSKKPQGDANWHVDHDHSCCPGTITCGECIRGILCGFCNRALGQFFDSPENLLNARDYILKYKDLKNNSIEDLQKAEFYLRDEIVRRKSL
jgi:hypothetical protein